MSERNSDKKFALERMQVLCSKSEKCSYDVRQKLNNYSLNEEDKNWIIGKLQKEKFLDDERYARFFVRDKFRFNKWGRLKIRQALFLKKMGEKIINQSMDEIDAEDYKRTARLIIGTKNNSLKDRNIFSRKGKLYRFAAQKGFESEIIYEIIDEIVSDN